MAPAKIFATAFLKTAATPSPRRKCEATDRLKIGWNTDEF
jgi:hypothetical protein